MPTAPRPVSQEPFALLIGICQFDEGIGQFKPANIKLESLRHPRVGRLAPRQRRQRRRPVHQECRTLLPQPRSPATRQTSDDLRAAEFGAGGNGQVWRDYTSELAKKMIVLMAWGFEPGRS